MLKESHYRKPFKAVFLFFIQAKDDMDISLTLLLQTKTQPLEHIGTLMLIWQVVRVEEHRRHHQNGIQHANKLNIIKFNYG